MARDIDITDHHSADARDGRTGSERPVETSREAGQGPAPSRERNGRIGRNYAYQVSQADLETMYDIGRFRTVATEDLAKERYAGRDREMGQDLRSLADQGLLEKRTIWTDRNKAKLAVVVLTKRGKELLEREFKD